MIAYFVDNELSIRERIRSVITLDIVLKYIARITINFHINQIKKLHKFKTNLINYLEHRFITIYLHPNSKYIKYKMNNLQHHIIFDDYKTCKSFYKHKTKILYLSNITENKNIEDYELKIFTLKK